jgi:hypothetical protein
MCLLLSLHATHSHLVFLMQISSSRLNEQVWHVFIITFFNTRKLWNSTFFAFFHFNFVVILFLSWSFLLFLLWHCLFHLQVEGTSSTIFHCVFFKIGKFWNFTFYFFFHFNFIIISFMFMRFFLLQVSQEVGILLINAFFNLKLLKVCSLIF